MMKQAQSISETTTVQPRLTALASSLLQQRMILGGSLMTLSVLSSDLSMAAPVNGNIVGGTGTISGGDALTTINQTSDKLAIEWDSFNLSNSQTVKFIQPDSSSMVLNRILDDNVSNIRGTIEANGHLLLVNPRGITFSQKANINVNGLIISALDIATDDFMNGDMEFQAVPGAEGFVKNGGTLNAANYVILQGNIVENQGLIMAARVELVAGSRTTVSLGVNELLGVAVEDETREEARVNTYNGILNNGTIKAEQIYLTADIADQLYTSAINNNGVLEARGIDNSGGVIRLEGSGAKVINRGTIDVSATGDGAGSINGSTVEIISDDNISFSTDASYLTTEGRDEGGTVHLTAANKVILSSGARITTGGGDLVVDAIHFENNGTISLADSSGSEINVGAGGVNSNNRLGDISLDEGSTLAVNGNSGNNKFRINEDSTLVLTGDDHAFQDGNLNYSSADEVQADDGVTLALQGSSGSDTFALTGVENEVEASEITFAGIQTVSGGSDENTLAGTAEADNFTLTGSPGELTANGIDFSELSAVDAGEGEDSLVGTTGNDGFFLTDTDKEVQTSGLLFTNIETVDGAGGSDFLSGTDADDSFALTEHDVSANPDANNQRVLARQVVFANIDEVRSGGGADSLQGTDLDEAYVVTPENKVVVNEITFTDLASVQAGGGNDTVTDNRSNQAWNVKGDNRAATDQVDFSDIERVVTSGMVTNMSGSDQAVTLNVDNLQVAGIVFDGSTDYTGSADDVDTITDSGNNNWSVTGDNSAAGGDHTLANVDVISTTGSVTNASGADQDVTLNDDDLSVAGIRFDGSTYYIGSASRNDTVTDNSNADWSITGNKALTDERRQLSQVEQINTAGDITDTTDSDWSVEGNKLASSGTAGITVSGTERIVTTGGVTNATEANQIVTLNENDLTVAGINFDGGTDYTGSADHADTITDTQNNSWNVTGDNAATAGNHTLANVDTITTTGSVNNDSNADQTVTLNENDLSVAGINFDGSTDYTGSADHVDTITDTQNNSWGVTDENTVTTENHTLANVDKLVTSGAVTNDTGSSREVVVQDNGFVVAGVAFDGSRSYTGNSSQGEMDSVAGEGRSWYLQEDDNTVETAYGSADDRGQFSNIAAVNDDSGDLHGTSADDRFSVTGNNNVTSKNIAFTGIRVIYAGDGADEIVGNNASWQLGNDDNQATVAGMTLFEAETVVDDSGEGLLAGSELDDTIRWLGNKTANSRGIDFTGISQIDSRGGQDTVYVDGEVESMTSLSGGAGDNDVLVNTTADLEWTFSTESASLGGQPVTEFESFFNEAGDGTRTDATLADEAPVDFGAMEEASSPNNLLQPGVEQEEAGFDFLTEKSPFEIADNTDSGAETGDYLLAGDTVNGTATIGALPDEATAAGEEQAADCNNPGQCE